MLNGADWPPFVKIGRLRHEFEHLDAMRLPRCCTVRMKVSLRQERTAAIFPLLPRQASVLAGSDAGHLQVSCTSC